MPKVTKELAVPDCPICGQPANKTNTHLVPWFLIKKAVTEKGVGLRDKQLSFKISARHPVGVHAARGVLPETQEELHEEHYLEPEEKDAFARDYIWCGDCEEKFSHLEDIFSDVFTEKRLMQQPATLNPYHGQRILIEEKLDWSMYQLFVHSVFWRCSFGKFDGFRLEEPIEAKLLENIRTAFSVADFLTLKKQNAVPIIHSFPLITSYLCLADGTDVTTNVVSTNKVRWPYMIVAAQWVFQLFEKVGHIRGTNQYLYGLRDALDVIGIYPKIRDRSHVVLVNSDDSKHFLQGLMQAVTAAKLRDEMEGARRVTRGMFDAAFKIRPKREQEDFVVGRYLAHRGAGKQEEESCELAFRELASAMGLPFEG